MIYNFNPGPSLLPKEVLHKVQDEFLSYQGFGYNIMEASHRGATFQDIIDQAEANIRTLLSIPENYAVLFLQGGASTQFAMIPMNILSEGNSADYALTGSWSEKALQEAMFIGKTHIAASSKDRHYDNIPELSQWNCQDNASYLHITSNNTIFGTQYSTFPTPPPGVPLVADMSSDILSRDIRIEQFALVYAGAQKNIGPSGVTLVIIKKELAEVAPANVPAMFSYTTHIKHKSLYNTPPTFAIYMVQYVTKWLLEQGGLKAVEQRNKEKANLIYNVIDQDNFYHCHAEKRSRSLMNICFRLPNQNMEKEFLHKVEKEGMIGLKGHRSVGGVRASLYNAMPLKGASKLSEFMMEFRQNQSHQWV